MKIAYTDLAEKAGVSYKYYPSLLELATNVDFLVVSAYGGPTTRGLVNAAVLNALGREGFLINIARGSLVDQAALVQALQTGGIRGAALDVFAEEPNVPAELMSMDNVVLTPHIASASIDTRREMSMLAARNAVAALEGRRPPTLLNPQLWDSLSSSKGA